MKVTFSGEKGDPYYLDNTDMVITLNGAQLLTQHPVQNDDELDQWRHMVRNWYVYEIGPNFVTFTSEIYEGTGRAVCLECGHSSFKNFVRCPCCRTLCEPIYKEA